MRKSFIRRALESNVEADIVDPDQLENSDLIESISNVEEATAAVERFYNDLDRLDQVRTTLESCHPTQITPAMVLAVEAHYVDYIDRSFASEAFTKAAEEDITDVKEKTGENVKTGVSKAMEKIAAVIRAGLKYLTELIDTVVSMIFDTRKSVVKFLEKARTNTGRPASVDITYNRLFKPLTSGGAFDANTVKQNQGIAAELVVACGNVVEDVINIAPKTKRKLEYHPERIRGMMEHFQKCFKSTGFELNTAGEYVISEDLGGRSITVYRTGSFTIENVDVQETRTTSSTFKRQEIEAAVKGALALMNAVDRYEPKIKAVRNTCRAIATADVANMALFGRPLVIAGVGAVSIYRLMSGYINMGLKLGIATAVQTATATARLVKAYDNSTAGTDDKNANGPDLSGVDFPRLSA